MEPDENTAQQHLLTYISPFKRITRNKAQQNRLAPPSITTYHYKQYTSIYFTQS